MDSEAKKPQFDEEAEHLEQEMREIEEVLHEVKDEEIRKTLREKYYVLLKKKLKKESEETESEASESEPESEPEVEPEEKQEVEPEKKEEKLHGIKKFGVDKETIKKLFESNEGSVHGFLEDIANMLPEYFENNEEMKKYIKNKCYVALRVKTNFFREGDEKDEQEDEYFAPITISENS
jgi:adenylosuccinate lyase